MATNIDKQIIALGDGGMDHKNPLLDLYILAQSNKPIPKICLIPTASGDNPGLIKYFYRIFEKYPCVVNHLSLFDCHTTDIESFLMEQDIVYVTGGHSRNMMTLWRDWGVDVILKKAYENGAVLSGGSAGSVCWFKECVTDSIPQSLTVMNCLDFLPYSNCPHFDSKGRFEAYVHYLNKNEISAGYGNDNGAALHFKNGEFLRSISSHQDSRCHKLYLENGICKHKTIQTYFLGKKENQSEFIWKMPPFKDLGLE